MSINSRFKDVRKDLKLSQTDFGKRIGISRDAVANIEGCRTEPSDIQIIACCKTFDVNEEWLRTGEGMMYAPVDDGTEAAQIAAEVINTTDKVKLKLMKQAVALIASMSEDQIRQVRDWAKELLEAVDED